MSGGRRSRVARLVVLAEAEQQRAQADVQAAAIRVQAVDRNRAEALAGASSLADPAVPLGLRGHLATAGARYLGHLADNKAELLDDLGQQRDNLRQATRKVRSLERLGERLDEAERRKQQLREAAELQDLVAVDAAAKRATPEERS